MFSLYYQAEYFQWVFRSEALDFVLLYGNLYPWTLQINTCHDWWHGSVTFGFFKLIW